MVEDINHNAMLGWLGPGTFPCYDPRCTLCTHVGRSPTVNLGRNRQLHLTKRASCSTKNVVYVGVCRQCEADGTFACYFGETKKSFHARCAEHRGNPCTNNGILKSKKFTSVKARRAEVARVIAAREDPDDVLRDWFSHITDSGIHPGQQRMSVVDIIPHTFLRQNRERNLVAEHMFRNGDFDYLGMGRGCLNAYGSTSTER